MGGIIPCGGIGIGGGIFVEKPPCGGGIITPCGGIPIEGGGGTGGMEGACIIMPCGGGGIMPMGGGMEGAPGCGGGKLAKPFWYAASASIWNCCILSSDCAASEGEGCADAMEAEESSKNITETASLPAALYIRLCSRAFVFMLPALLH